MADSEAGVTPTVLLYQTDSYVREFEAQVGARGARRRAGPHLVLPWWRRADGRPRGADIAGRPIRSRPCERVATSLGTNWTGAARAACRGREAHGALDWAFRYQMMRTHTALHS